MKWNKGKARIRDKKWEKGKKMMEIKGDRRRERERERGERKSRWRL